MIAVQVAGATTEVATLDTLSAEVRLDFQRRVDAYISLRSSILKLFPPPSRIDDRQTLDNWQKSLSTALRAARLDAKPGDIIPPAVAAAIAASVARDFSHRSNEAASAVLSEVPDATPKINAIYPDDEARPPLPALLLNSLPPLPEGLQYRFYGRHLILLDADVPMIVDYILNVVPRTPR